MIVSNQQLGCVVGNYIDVRINGQQDFRIARVEQIEPQTTLLILYEVKGTHAAQTSKTEEVDPAKHQLEPFRRCSGLGIPSSLRQGTIRLKVTVEEIQHVMGQLQQFPFDNMQPAEIVQLVRGRHPFTVESLLTSDNNPAQLIKIYKDEYMPASLTFWVQYLCSLKFSHYTSKVAQLLEQANPDKKIPKGNKLQINCYASRQAALESAYAECFQSLNSIINIRSRGRLYSASYDCLQEMNKTFSTWYAQKFILKIDIAVSCLRDAKTLVPMKYVFHLMNFVNGIITYKDHMKLLSTSLIKEILKLHLNCLEMLEKMPTDCAECLFQDVVVPDSLEKFGDSEVEKLSSTINLKLIMLYAAFKFNYEKIEYKMNKIVQKEENLSKLAQIFENSNILDYILSEVNEIKVRTLSDLSDILSRLCNTSVSLMEKTVATLFQSKNPYALSILSQVLSRAPNGVRSTIFNRIDAIEPGDKSQTVFSFALKMGSIYSNNLFRTCAKLCYKHLNYCQDTQVKALAEFLEKGSTITIDIINQLILELGTEHETDQCWILLQRLFEKFKTQFNDKMWCTLKEGIIKNILKYKESVPRCRKRLTILNAALENVKPKSTDLDTLIQLYFTTSVEQIRWMVAKKFFFQGEAQNRVAIWLQPAMLQTIYTGMLKFELKEQTQYNLFLCIFYELFSEHGFIKQPRSDEEKDGMKLLLSTLFECQDAQMFKIVETRVGDIYLDIFQEHAESMFKQIVLMVIQSSTQQAFYFLGHLYEKYQNRCQKDKQRMRSSNLSVNSQVTQKIQDDSAVNLKNLQLLKSIIDSHYEKFYDNLPTSWHFIERRGFENTPVGKLIDAAKSQQQWSVLMSPELQFKKRYYVIRYIQTNKITTEQLIERKAPTIFQKTLQLQNQFSQKMSYNLFIIDLLQAHYRQAKAEEPTFCLIYRILLRIFNRTNYLAKIDSDTTIKYINNTMQLLLQLTDSSFKHMIQHGLFVQFIIDFVQIEVAEITEHFIKKIITLLDNSGSWSQGVQQLVDYKTDPDTEKELLMFVSQFIDNSQAVDDEMLEQLLQVTCILSIMDGNVSSSRMNGILYVLISILSRRGGFIKDISVQAVQQLLTFTFFSSLFEPTFKLLTILNNSHKLRLEMFNFFGRRLLKAKWNSDSIIDEMGNPQHRHYFVGLDNPRCICYMNSFLQQLYHILPFSEMILRTKWNRLKNDEEDMILQMKRLFLNLQKLTRDSYNNEPFYYDAFRNSDGKRIDITEQMDVDEFSKNLFDRLEKALEGQQNIVKELFGGQIVTTITCDECKQVSPRYEDSYSIHLDISSGRLERAFEQFTKAQIMENDNAYYCEKCSKKVKAEKKTNIHVLPKMMLVVLNRFWYNRNVGKQKINSLFQFPMGTFKTSKDLCQSQEAFYRLRGVVVHRGHAQSGHYFSYIMIDGRWYLFNDSEVNRVRREDVKVSSYGDHRSMESGYLLIYERQDTDWQNLNSRHEQLYEQPSDILKINEQIEQDQLKVLFFSQEMGEFIDSCLQYDSTDILSMQFYWLYFYHIKLYSCDSHQKICQYLSDRPSIAAKNFMSVSQISNVLTLKVDKCIEFKHLYCHLLAQSIHLLEDDFLEDLINKLIVMTYDHPQSNQVYLLLAKMTNFKPEVTKMLIDKKMVGRIFDVFYYDFGDNKDNNVQGFKSLMRNMTDIGYKGKVDMVKHEYNKSLPRYRWVLLKILLESGYAISPEEQAVIQEKNTKIIKKIIEQATVKININRISWFLCYMAKNSAFLDNIIFVLNNILQNPKIQNLRTCFKIIKDLCKMHNKNQYHVKIDILLRMMINVMKDHCQYSISSDQKTAEPLQDYRAEPRVHYELTFQWLIRIMDRVECFRDRVEHEIRIGGMQFIENVQWRPYRSSKIYFQNNEPNDYTRNYFHNLEIITNEKQHQKLYMLFRQVYNNIKFGRKHQVISVEVDSDDDLFMADIKKNSKIILVHRTSRGMIKEKMEVLKVMGESLMVSGLQSPEYTYNENVCRMDDEESFQ